MKANAYRMLKKEMLEALLIQWTPPPNITFKNIQKMWKFLALGVFPQ